MDAIDGTTERQHETESPPPSLLVLVLDTNPRAWAHLSSTLPLSRAVATLLVFINAHLAFSHENRVAVIASHCQRTVWLYPTPSTPQPPPPSGSATLPSKQKHPNHPTPNANKYLPFAQVEAAVQRNLAQLLKTTDADAAALPTTQIAGALTLALSYINKTSLTLTSTTSASAADQATQQSRASNTALTSRILVVSASGDLAAQYIPLMNAMFGAQHVRIAIDILKLVGDSVLLQQASFTTGGIFLSPAVPATLPSVNQNDATSTPVTPNPQGLLQYLFQAFLPDATARAHLLPPTSPNVDFRAACFCHRRVVDIGYVCSICLSIFCEDLKKELGFEGRDWPEGGVECLTCGTRLVLRGATTGQDGGEKEKKKKKKKKDRDRDKESGNGTPAQESGPG
ncbi:hypothetical protein FH972_022363 [Carpinus fangiana]|uniref:General transcription and DNA repair factor IIH subunit TFB4 n=1 Tax=Carpinus fangiana TaxID=176857 RepID=A0A5N6KSK7_9ROSI|nr:hypothetical protein FH972_022363 [Carpinus fangiana]